MDIYWAIIYGIIQGLTEFLPVSSSGHLALVPYFANFKDPGLVFDLAMHFGTALAVLIYFRIEVLRIITGSWKSLRGELDYFAISFILATGITGFFALIIKEYAESYGRNPVFIAINLCIFGVILFVTDKFGKNKTDTFEQKSGVVKALFIGLSQVLAIFPGVSRSGITISMARYLNIPKDEASRFSFLLSLPLIFAGILLKSRTLISSNQNFDLLNCLVGVIVSFIVGYGTIHFFLRLLKKIKFSHFMYYRILLALIIFYIHFSN